MTAWSRSRRMVAKTWRKSTLPGIPDARISAIDPSPHDTATAYVAATRFQFDDVKPYLFKTTDWGKTWTRLGADLPAWTRVVREDPGRKGLLYAGTEVGVFVSFDDGVHWRPLQSKLPLTPINDLLVHDGDLVAATSGRSVWMLDDLAPLRQLDPASEASPATGRERLTGPRWAAAIPTSTRRLARTRRRARSSTSSSSPQARPGHRHPRCVGRRRPPSRCAWRGGPKPRCLEPARNAGSADR